MLRIGPYELPNPYVLAPMAGVSERPFRVLAFRLGAALCPTELVSAQGLMRANARTLKYLRFDADVERPYSLQIFGGEVEAMAKAAVIGKEYGAQIIDINMGCPVKKVTKNGAGSALLCEPARAGDLVREIGRATGLPVTAKIRSGWDANSRNYLQMAEVLQEAGVADAHRMLETTRCDYVMVGRAALGNPWIFRELLGGPPATPAERCTLVLEHLRAHLDFMGDPLGAVRSFRKQLAWYAHGLYGAAAFRAEVNTLDGPADVEACVRRFFAAANADLEGPGEEQDVDYRAALG